MSTEPHTGSLPSPVISLGRDSARHVLARGFRLRCPSCGRSSLFTGWFSMAERCGVCGLLYEREAGYFIGAIYVNYAVTVAVAAGTVLLLDWTVGLSLGQQLVVGIVLAGLVPLVFFRYARSLWLSVDFLVTTLDEQRPRRPRG